MGILAAITSVFAMSKVAAASGVEIYNSSQCGQAAVVHVRCGVADVAQGGGAVVTHVFGVTGNVVKTAVVIGISTFPVEIVKTSVVEGFFQNVATKMGCGLGKVKSTMAVVAFKSF